MQISVHMKLNRYLYFDRSGLFLSSSNSKGASPIEAKDVSKTCQKLHYADEKLLDLKKSYPVKKCFSLIYGRSSNSNPVKMIQLKRSTSPCRLQDLSTSPLPLRPASRSQVTLWSFIMIVTSFLCSKCNITWVCMK